MNNIPQPVYTKKNFRILFLSLFLLASGFFIMTLDTEPYGFGSLGITIGPALVVLGFIATFFSIFTDPKYYRSGSNYNLFNTICGWLVFGIALTIYILTLEPTTSFWDCGEFIASAYKLQVPHPPGAPLFLLVGRMFSLLAFGDVSQVAYWVNMVSAVSSAFTILFLFWTITILAKKILIPNEQAVTSYQTCIILCCGLIGALSYTFSDSFWFSAVEAEVYAFSSFFTAFVVWAILKWSITENTKNRYLWLILIAYMVGLSIGVHLLNLVAIPAMALVYYHRNYRFSISGFLLTVLISLGIIGVIMWGVIPGLPGLAGSFEIFFVNVMGLPFGSGILIFIVLFISGLIWFFRYAMHKQKHLLQTAILGFIYILIGYSSYLIIPIRSSYDPLIDENNPENIMSFVSYLKREQYEQRPLLYGPQFSSKLIQQQKGSPVYAKTGTDYKIADYKYEAIYDEKDQVLLPRVYSNLPHHVHEYKKWISIQNDQIPTFSQNFSYLINYQLVHMYWRYFMWNFAGRDSDIQQAGIAWPWENEQNLPHAIATNKAHNIYWLLPLVLGIAGCVFHFRKRKKDACVVLVLFIFSGMAIAFFLNQPPIEPRERDYAFVGSFYAFSIWIGLGILVLKQFFEKLLKNQVFIAIMTILLGLVVPIKMAAEGWDDHDRSDRFYALDFARNLLESCKPNAILFTNGDNDTFPLWYAQEVEGIRTDVRVIVLTYLNTDWYISQMKRQAYKSDPLPISLQAANYQFNVNSYLPFVENKRVSAGIDLKQFVELVKKDHPALKVMAQDGRSFIAVPTKKFYLNINRQSVLANNVVPETREKDIVSKIEFTIAGNGMEKKDLVIADILATNNWKRPIYFSSSSSAEFLNYLRPYLQLEGLAYRVVPVKNNNQNSEVFVAKDIMFKNLMEKFSFRNLNNTDIYYDNIYQSQQLPTMRKNFALLAEAFLQSGENDKARQVVSFVLNKLPDDSLPYDYYSPKYIELLHKTGQKQKAEELFNTMAARAEKAITYYANQKHRAIHEREINLNMLSLQQLVSVGYTCGMQNQAAELEQFFISYYKILM